MKLSLAPFLCIALLAIFPRVDSLAAPAPPRPPLFLKPSKVGTLTAETAVKPLTGPGGREVLARATVIQDATRVEGCYCRLALIERVGVEPVETVLRSWTQDAAQCPSLATIRGDHGTYVALSTVGFDGLTELTIFQASADLRDLALLYRWGGRDGGTWLCPQLLEGDPILIVRKAAHIESDTKFRWDRERLTLLRFGKALTGRYPVGTIGELYPTEDRADNTAERDLAFNCCNRLAAMHPLPKAFRDWYPLFARGDLRADEVMPQELSENPLEWKEE